MSPPKWEELSPTPEWESLRTAEALRLLGMEPKSPSDQTLYQSAAQGATKAIGERGGPLAEGIARFVIPQNEAELGMALGTVGGAGIASKLGAKGLEAAALRILGGAAGAEAGGQYAGQTPGVGAATGTVAGIAGETAAPLMGWLVRSVPGMKQYINKVRSQKIGELVESGVPPLAGARDPHALDQMARDFELGKGPLFEYYGQLKRTLEEHIGGQKLHIPELASPENIAEAKAIRAELRRGTDLPDRATLEQRAKDLESVPISDVYEELKKTGHYGFGGSKANPNTRTIVGQEPRMEYDQLIKKTKAQLDQIDETGALSKEFESGRKTAAAGFTFLKMLQSPRAFVRYPKDVQLNIPWIQEYVNQNQTEIKRKIGKDAFSKLREVLWPGGGKMGTRDVPISTGGNLEDVPMETLRGIGGSPRIITAPLRTILPSIGAQYAGEAPFTPGSTQRLLVDLLMQRGLAPFVDQPNARERLLREFGASNVNMK